MGATFPPFAVPFTGNAGTQTANIPIFSLSQTWNNAGVTFNGLLINITDTNSNASSTFIELQIAGVRKLAIFKSGRAALTGVDVNGGTVSSGQTASGNIDGIRVWNAGFYSFSSTTDSNAAADLILVRDAAAILAQRNGVNAQTFRIYNTYTDASNYERAMVGWQSNVFVVGPTAAGTGTNRSMGLRTSGTVWWTLDTSGNIAPSATTTYLKMAVTTVGALPAAATAGAGARMAVSDALTPVFGSTVTGGGAVTAPVYSDGTNWKVG